MKTLVKNPFLIKTIGILLGFSVIITFHCFAIFNVAFGWWNFGRLYFSEELISKKITII